MSLPLQAVDRLFARLHATYGRDFESKYVGIDTAAVKTSWAHELAGFAGDLASIAWALENLPERCPNVIEFRAICRKSPAPDVPRIEHASAGHERIAAELAKLAPVTAQRTSHVDGKEWARRIIENDKNGIRSRSPLPLRMAREAFQ